MEKNALMNLPYIVDGDIVITQSNACLMYLGRKCASPLDEVDGLAVEQCLCQLMDLRNDTTRTAYSPTRDGLAVEIELHLQSRCWCTSRSSTASWSSAARCTSARHADRCRLPPPR